MRIESFIKRNKIRKKVISIISNQYFQTNIFLQEVSINNYIKRSILRRKNIYEINFYTKTLKKNLRKRNRIKKTINKRKYLIMF